MPNTSPTSKMLKKLGLSIPDINSLSPIDKATQDRVNKEALASQEKDPTWKKWGRNAIDSIVGAAKGIVSVDPEEGESWFGKKANLGMQAAEAGLGLKTAGVPIMAHTKGKPIYHGTRRSFDKFDHDRYDTSDVLGWMTHGAVDPKYADKYASGAAKDNVGLPEWVAGKPRQIPAERIIPMKPENKNTLDLIDPNMDDVAQAMASMDPMDREFLIERYKTAKRSGNLPEWMNYNTRSKEISEADLPVKYLADQLRLGEEEFRKTPFDAIRYRDVNNESYAIPKGTPIKSAYGAPLTEDAKPLKVFRETGERKSPLTKSSELQLHNKGSDYRMLPYKPKPELFKNNPEKELMPTGKLGLSYDGEYGSNANHNQPLDAYSGMTNKEYWDAYTKKYPNELKPVINKPGMTDKEYWDTYAKKHTKLKSDK